jgi:hypothetical protein
MELKNMTVEILEKAKMNDEMKIHKVDYYKRY